MTYDGRWYRANKERVLENNRKWRNDNPGPNAVWRRWQELRKRGLGNRIVKWSIRFFEEEAYALAKLRTKLTGIPWDVDHIYPLKHPDVSGLHVHNNLQVIPKKNNISKGNSLIIRFRAFGLIQGLSE